ncbi:hypothetical protein [Companilactobacillus furfuricola]|uniref:hypothetical protein n=1 Tax=Companilactobacillus furfuricola TaxID=1462575 RepID=UPI0013DE5245|nr:hypothetical protein [Companilactobacillus furfuricola]
MENIYQLMAVLTPMIFIIGAYVAFFFWGLKRYYLTPAKQFDNFVSDLMTKRLAEDSIHNHMNSAHEFYLVMWKPTISLRHHHMGNFNSNIKFMSTGDLHFLKIILNYYKTNILDLHRSVIIILSIFGAVSGYDFLDKSLKLNLLWVVMAVLIGMIPLVILVYFYEWNAKPLLMQLEEMINSAINQK